MLRITLAGICATALVAAALAGCGGSGGGSGEVKVGVVLKDVAGPYWQEAETGAKQAGEEDGIDVSIAAVKSESDVEEQINKVENELAKGVEALVVAPTIPEQLEPVLERAAGEGVKVVLIDTDMPEFKQKVSFVGTENTEAGEIAGKYIKEQLKGKGSLGMVVALPGVTSVDQREAGVETTVGSGIEVVKSGEHTECITEKGVTATENLLTAHPTLDALFGSCGENLLGGAIAVKNAGRANNMLMVSVDATPETLKQVETGEIDATVAQFPSKMGYFGVKVAAEAVEGKTVKPYINTGAGLVTKENLAEMTKRLAEPATE
jgi:ABC-type sugar transport system substrate-binding protein